VERQGQHRTDRDVHALRSKLTFSQGQPLPDRAGQARHVAADSTRAHDDAAALLAGTPSTTSSKVAARDNSNARPGRTSGEIARRETRAADDETDDTTSSKVAARTTATRDPEKPRRNCRGRETSPVDDETTTAK